jgi:hypothetical protein
MATVTKRQIRATPHRTATETWELISKLLAPDDKSSARAELATVAGVVGQAIASESPKDSPIVVQGKGPRVRLYCLYDEDSITGDDANENSLASAPTDGDWKISIPVLAEDLDWTNKELKSRSSRITARVVGDPLDEDEDEQSSQRAEATVNLDAFLNS